METTTATCTRETHLAAWATVDGLRAHTVPAPALTVNRWTRQQRACKGCGMTARITAAQARALAPKKCRRCRGTGSIALGAGALARCPACAK